MELEALIRDLTTRMDGAMEKLEQNLSGLRTGRASPKLLEGLMVHSSYGDKRPVQQLATVAVPDPRSLQVRVWDSSNTKPIEKAIAESQLGLQPIVEGQVIRISIPPLTEDRRKELAKAAGKYGEETKIAIRNIRRDGLEEVKKAVKKEALSEDQQHLYGEKIQKLTDEYVSTIERYVTEKEHDIQTI